MTYKIYHNVLLLRDRWAHLQLPRLRRGSLGQSVAAAHLRRASLHGDLNRTVGDASKHLRMSRASLYELAGVPDRLAGRQLSDLGGTRVNPKP